MLSSFRSFRPLLTATASLLLTAGTAQAQDSTLTRLIQKYQLPLVQTGQQFSGTGWDKLQQEIAKSQFVLVGEAHGTAQIPQLTAALAQVLQPKVFVGEISPFEAQELNRLTANPDALKAYQQQHPYALSFYSWSAEFALARQLRAQNVAVLGVDQVSLFAPGRYYTRLAELSKSKATKAYLLQRAAAFQAHDRAVISTDPTLSTLIQQSKSSLDSLVAMTRQESPAVRALVQDYLTSAQIYQSYKNNGMQSHQQRIGHMKHNLLQQLRPFQPTGQEPLPKMLMKFGYEHAGRGLSFNAAIYDVGSLATNLADAQNQKSLHILVTGKQGSSTGGFDPDDASKNVRPYSVDQESPLLPFYTHTTGSAWNVVNLRAMRQLMLLGKLKVADPRLERIILGYDFMVVIPETTANPAL